MVKTVQQAEADVAKARAVLREDLRELKDWFFGVTPLMRFLAGSPRFRRNHRAYFRDTAALPLVLRIADGARANPLPLFLVMLGAGWILRNAARSRRSAEIRFEGKAARYRRRR